MMSATSRALDDRTFPCPPVDIDRAVPRRYAGWPWPGEAVFWHPHTVDGRRSSSPVSATCCAGQPPKDSITRVRWSAGEGPVGEFGAPLHQGGGGIVL